MGRGDWGLGCSGGRGERSGRWPEAGGVATLALGCGGGGAIRPGAG